MGFAISDADGAVPEGRRASSASAPEWIETVDKLIISAIPVIGGPLSVVYEDVAARRRAAANDYVERVNELVSGEAEEFLGSSQRMDDLFLLGARGYIQTDYEAKKQLLARVVARAILDDALVDKSFQMVQTIESLDSVHVVALARMRDEEVDPDILVSDLPFGPVWNQRVSRFASFGQFNAGELRNDNGPVVFHQMLNSNVVALVSGTPVPAWLMRYVFAEDGRVRRRRAWLVGVWFFPVGLCGGLIRNMIGMDRIRLTRWGRTVLTELETSAVD